MITNLRTILEIANAKRIAIGSFNVYNYETIKGVIESIKESQVPGIIAFGEKYLNNMELKEIVNLIRTMAVKVDQPIAIHLDHCKSFKTIKQAIDVGFTSVMIDASHLPFEENIKRTKQVTDYAKQFSVSVEAELGSIELGDCSNEDEGKTIYTDPLMAKEFVKRTNVDALAVSIGTVHGMYKGEPNVSVKRLKSISEQVNTPLVLHGGSGTPVHIIKECIENGICKINVNTELSVNVVKAIRKEIECNPNVHFSTLSAMSVESVKESVKKYIEIFSQ